MEEIRLAKKGDGRGLARLLNEILLRGLASYGWQNVEGIEEIKAYDKAFAKSNKNEFIFVAADTNTGKIIGGCNFFAKELGITKHRGEVGWAVHPDCLRRGIATRLLKAVSTEAKKRGFKRIEAEMAVTNIASIRLAKRCGFVIEGRRKLGYADNEKYIDTYLMGKILK